VKNGRPLAVAMLGPGVAWTVHLLVGYLIVSAWCANRWHGVTTAHLVLTALCIAATVACAILARGLWRRGQEHLDTDREPGTPEGWDARMGERGARITFLALMALFMALLFGFLIVLQGTPPFFTPMCPATTVP
jgi:hypothetical protein